MKNIRLVLFDFDGVLLDSGTDIAASINATLEHFNYKPVETKKIITFVGDGMTKLVGRSVNQSMGKDITAEIAQAELEPIIRWYLDYYLEHSVVHSTLYDGTAELLPLLQRKGIKMGIVSNKPHAITLDILQKFSIKQYFCAVIGPELLTHIKPHPEGLQLALDIANKTLTASEKPIDKGEVLMVGDSATDIQAGRNLGAMTCAHLNGLGNKQDLLNEKADVEVNSLVQLKEYFS